ncbi:MAG: twin-arginine translocase subunit TatB [Boseongicola sp.]|nr:twin-arginine translocase subunit TatB [Boseongicola sp.]
MFDLSWGELLVVGVVGLIILGPRDLVGMFRTLGRFVGKARRMAREFQRAMEDAADEAGVKDVADNLKGVTSPSRAGLDTLNKAAKRFEDWDPTKPSRKAKEIGPETEKLSEERAEAARKIREYSTEKAAAARAAESKAAETKVEAEAEISKPEPESSESRPGDSA